MVNREVGSLSLDPSPTPGNVSVSSPTPADTSSGLWTPIESVKMEIAISLSLLVGIIQVMYFHILYFRDCAIIIRRGVGRKMSLARRNITQYPPSQQR